MNAEEKEMLLLNMAEITEEAKGFDQMIRQGISKYRQRDCDNLAQLFNNKAIAFLQHLNQLAVKYKKTKECNFDGLIYKFNLLQQADYNVPILEFGNQALPFAKRIYVADDEFFMNMDLPEIEVEADSYNFLFDPKLFKSLYKKVINSLEKEEIFKMLGTVTMIANAYFANAYSKHIAK